MAASSLVSSLLPSDANSSNNLAYGVDWSNCARPTTHCWFPYITNDISHARQCLYGTCSEHQLTRRLSFVQCGSCTLIVHKDHLTYSQMAKDSTFPDCRPSFIDKPTQENSYTDVDNDIVADGEHFWSYVPDLSELCAYCNRKSFSKILSTTENEEASSMSDKNKLFQDDSTSRILSRSFEQTVSQYFTGIVCLWCSRSYHRRCWCLISTQIDQIKCDYGALRDIVVRPQWLHRSNESALGFRATLSSYSGNKSAELKQFPYTPTLFFINKYSGGQNGEKIYRKLLKILNPRQIFLLENDTTIINAINIYFHLPNTRICIFGGDGTVNWIVSHVAEVYSSNKNPPIIIGPLGTCNDLSRVLGWGAHFNSKLLYPTLLKISQANVVSIDRWQIYLEPLNSSHLTLIRHQEHDGNFQISQIFEPLFRDPKFIREINHTSYQNYRELPSTCFINYMSFGLDAAIAIEFHDRRKHNPVQFSSSWRNKLIYLSESWKYIGDFMRSKLWNLGSYVRLICDGEDLTNSIGHYHSLLVLNIPAYVSGTNPWGKSSSINKRVADIHSSSIRETDNCSLDDFSAKSADIPSLVLNSNEVDASATWNNVDMSESATPLRKNEIADHFKHQDIGDQKLEVIGLSTRHMAMIHFGFQGRRIAQCNQLRIECCCPMTAHMDGEPFYLPNAVAINITHAGQVLMLRNEDL